MIHLEEKKMTSKVEEFDGLEEDGDEGGDDHGDENWDTNTIRAEIRNGKMVEKSFMRLDD